MQKALDQKGPGKEHDDEGVIVAGPDARARARGEKKDDAAVEKKGIKRDPGGKPTRDTRDSPSENPKTSASG